MFLSYDIMHAISPPLVVQSLVHLYLGGKTPFALPKLEKNGLSRKTDYSNLLTLLKAFLKVTDGGFTLPDDVKREMQKKLSAGSPLERSSAGEHIFDLVGGLIQTKA